MPNRLSQEMSPYLLQHANNPVDWFPWGEEAFQKAAEEDKPIFLSIGYATCHWCHVMERESFEDQEVADLLNRYFVSIKVDREERPDVDHLYMAVCQALRGTGGWPLSIFMTPDRKPFFAGSYFPKSSRLGIPGLTDVVLQLAHLWKNERGKVVHAGKRLPKRFSRRNHPESPGRLSPYQFWNRHMSSFGCGLTSAGEASERRPNSQLHIISPCSCGGIAAIPSRRLSPWLKRPLKPCTMAAFSIRWVSDFTAIGG